MRVKYTYKFCETENQRRDSMYIHICVCWVWVVDKVFFLWMGFCVCAEKNQTKFSSAVRNWSPSQYERFLLSGFDEKKKTKQINSIIISCLLIEKKRRKK